MISRIVLIFAAAAGLVLATAACGGGGEERPERDPSRGLVVASVYPLAWVAEEIGRQSYDVVNATPPGAEPHDVELSARDVEDIREANAVFYVGEGFQPAFERAAADASGIVVDVLSEVPTLETALGTDPHVWLDPRRLAQIVIRIGGSLDVLPEAQKLIDRLQQLDTEFRRGLARCARRDVVTSHGAFGYLADAYGLRQLSIAGLTPEAEPSPRELEAIVGRVRATGATTVFTEPLVSADVAETVAREVGAETAVLDPIEGLSEESTGSGETYLTVMRRNLAALRQALGCR
jgi:zinc transport system substrate-binding protein